ncbi:hypothetical protein I5677_05270 [Mobilitalea sibirica]|uniref:Uncharacterized protein n=1 Tax=Mobilitalea sibirica TaxID=1462919 RepID=A0A8J7H1V4_9FIRM|nr:DUF6514 family protein [Mobilitalea sibirica]MBH1940305.1 hypothetical protein [Mobilitalea sibirica]
MIKAQVVFSNEVVLEDKRSMKLDYCLTEKELESNPTTSYYGIRITKHMDNQVETEEVCGISYSKDTVLSMLKKLFQHEVTPISMVEILDDLVTQYS